MFVVAIGASAGGVPALESLFEAMPPDSGAAFLVMTHANVHRESLLGDILARRTKMPLSDGAGALRRNHVHVLPAGAVVTSNHGALEVAPAPLSQHEHNPIDAFFASVAKCVGENGVAVVLSGAGSDGSLGVKAVKEEGGLTIAQGVDGAGPDHESMPASAIATGLIDLVLPVHQIGPKLREYFRSCVQLRASGGAVTRASDAASALNDILATLRRRVGHDFAQYKEKTLLRRIQRRMQVLHAKTLPEYAERLKQEGEEAGLLFRDLLIGVTSFFRDADAFDMLATKVIPKIFENMGLGDTVRVWVPGCSTGEEAYSIAMLMREHMLQLASPPRVQVFATDIDEPALTVARSGRYPRAMLEHVAPERIKRFFRPEATSYVLNKDVRDLCVFSSHSVIRDPPFSRMDLVSCRNLLIYFSAELQDNVLPVFHYALKSGGFLFLGPSESASRHSDLFSAVDKKHGVYQRRSIMNGNLRMPSWVATGRTGHPDHPADAGVRKDQRLWKQVEAQIMESYAPPHIVVEADGDIVYYSARTGKYLEPQMGSPSRQLLSMVRKGLRLELRSVLREAAEKRATATRERIEVELEDRVQFVKLTVQPMRLSDQDQEPLYLVVFTDLGPPISHEEAALNRPAHPIGDVGSLEQELRETRDRLQATIEEYETALEELKSGNEELVSVNEELQSTNEELETSKEELQSVNEELNSVNHELASKVDELHQSNADLRNLFESTQIATVFLDRFMVIRSFTPAVRAIVNLISADRGRPITDIAHQLEDVDLRADVRKVLDTRQPLERSVRQRGGKIFHLMRILPYRTSDDEVDGALITFFNVTEMVAAEEQQRLLVAELNHRVRNMLQVVIGLCNQTLHRSADLKEFETAFLGRMQALGRAYELLSREGWRHVSLEELAHKQLAAFVPNEGRYSAHGPPVEIRPNAALALGLVFYELATNATKYGALSGKSGHVHLEWEMVTHPTEGQRLLVHWVERGGPDVSTPEHTGFGTELFKRQLRYELDGDVQVQFVKEGVEVTLTLPARAVVLTGAADLFSPST